MLLVSSSRALADPDRLTTLLQRAEAHEKAREWDKAYAYYDEILKTRRDLPAIRERQLAVLRRFWQEQRHRDLSYRKEVLGLDYGQAIQLYSSVFDTLLDSSFRRPRVAPGQLLQRGIEELQTAVDDPTFAQLYLSQARAGSLASFRSLLARKKSDAASYQREQVLKTLREIALAAKNKLEMAPTVAIMEIACGSCHAIDEYTSYLTPNQFRELADTLKGAAPFMASVQYDVRGPEIGYLQIALFQESTPQEVDVAFATLTKNGMKGLVLDLRGNAGGLLESSIEVARRFLASGVIASTENYDPKLSMVYQSRNPAAWVVPLVVLVDGDTASAAEVLAGALKENGRARLVGQPTFGKGFSQGLVKLPDAVGGMPTGGLRLTIARFLSPKGTSYQGQGVTPDLVLERFRPDGMGPLDDQQMQEAIAELQRQLYMR
jgi:C-terminal processing protease CtpA/Prc